LSGELIFPIADGPLARRPSASRGEGSIRRTGRSEPRAEAVQRRLDALVAVARFHGHELDRRDFRAVPGEAIPSPAALATWLRESGLWANAVRLRWRQLFRVQSDAPLVLLFSDGSAGLLVAKDAARDVVFLKEPQAPPGDPPTAVDELRLLQLWQGEVLLVRRVRGASPEEEPFTLAWLSRLVLGERRNLREIMAASLTLSALQILPPFLVMVAIDRVLTHHSMSTLALIGLILALTAGYETLLGYARERSWRSCPRGSTHGSTFMSSAACWHCQLIFSNARPPGKRRTVSRRFSRSASS
jgi:subfamily B ATP-binding cassette protein HlyB/CyaB